MGAKRRLIRKGLIDLFPKKIDRYYEPFAESCIVAMNVKANNYYLNDIDKHLYALYQMFKGYKAWEIISYIEYNIEQYHLPQEGTRREDFQNKEKIAEYKKAYNVFRQHYNLSGNIIDFYILTIFSFSHQFRHNGNGEYNMPYGNDFFRPSNKENIYDGCIFFTQPNVSLYSMSFENFFEYKDIVHAPDNTFVYLDPPYLHTTAVYNESRGEIYPWTAEREDLLRHYCKLFTQHHIKFAMSNVFANRGFDNVSLKEWCAKNNYNVHHFDHCYSACGKGNSQTDEVLIMNY